MNYKTRRRLAPWLPRVPRWRRCLNHLACAVGLHDWIKMLQHPEAYQPPVVMCHWCGLTKKPRQGDLK